MISILHTSVRMKNQLTILTDFSFFGRQIKSFNNCISSSHISTQTPAYNHSISQINDYSKVCPLMSNPNMSNITDPASVGFRNLKVSIKHVFRNWKFVVRVSCMPKLLSRLGNQF